MGDLIRFPQERRTAAPDPKIDGPSMIILLPTVHRDMPIVSDETMRLWADATQSLYLLFP